MNNTDYNIYEFPECESIVISGDIHGDFNLLVNKMCVQYRMENTLMIVAGDCGFGFQNKGYYENIVKRNAKRMNAANNWILFVRGNHDNPAYFDGKTFRHKRFIAIPDYSIVKACGHTLLCIGGAISIDRSYRLNAWEQIQKKRHQPSLDMDKEIYEPNYYWSNEKPVFNTELLGKIMSEQSIDTVITHTSPSFCELQNKNGLSEWGSNDAQLLADVQQERQTMDSIYHLLKESQTVTHWCYGHFHQSWHSNIEEILFKMLDIKEFYEIKNIAIMR